MSKEENAERGKYRKIWVRKISEENVDKENVEEEKFERGKYRNRERRKENLNELKEENWTIWSFSCGACHIVFYWEK